LAVPSTQESAYGGAVMQSAWERPSQRLKRCHFLISRSGPVSSIPPYVAEGDIIVTEFEPGILPDYNYTKKTQRRSINCPTYRPATPIVCIAPKKTKETPRERSDLP